MRSVLLAVSKSRWRYALRILSSLAERDSQNQDYKPSMSTRSPRVSFLSFCSLPYPSIPAFLTFRAISFSDLVLDGYSGSREFFARIDVTSVGRREAAVHEPTG
jgi:hypothetical protein